MIDPHDLKHQLRTIALQRGVDLFGVADLSVPHDFIVAQGGAYLGKFPRGVSIAIGLSPSVVDALEDRDEVNLAKTYHEYIYGIVNPRLNDVALQITQELMREGHQAYLVPASQPFETTAIFSQKLAAHMAGIGFIGRSCLLVTPEFGGRVRLATVLTDALLPADESRENSCGDCRRCVDVCPVQAFTGAEFRPEDARDARMNAEACRRYLEHRHKTIGRAVCGMCVNVCVPRLPAHPALNHKSTSI